MNAGSDTSIAAVPCELPTDVSFDELFEDEDFSWVTPRRRATIPSDELDTVYVNPEEEVRVCYCQAAPKRLPRKFTPCCLPSSAVLAAREIQMKDTFKDNLMGSNGSPLKTQTLREWCPARAREHQQSFVHGKWVRVWVGQGHASTIGWLRITKWDTIEVGGITTEDCVREGRPQWTPTRFKREFFPKNLSSDKLIRLQFYFRGCKRHV